MISYQITLSDSTLEPEQNTEPMTNHTRGIIQYLLGASTQRTLYMELTPDNQLKFAEEKGYRRALLELSSYYEGAGQ